MLADAAMSLRFLPFIPQYIPAASNLFSIRVIFIKLAYTNPSHEIACIAA
jgi:hypothetical protein